MKLRQIIKVIWRMGKLVDQWKYAEDVWIPKEEDSRDIEQFHNTFLLSAESEIFKYYLPTTF